jgi:hypothetical protein
MTSAIRPLCPGCKEPVGAYEPLARVSAATAGAEPTSWLAERGVAAGETLWHAACARRAGLQAA